jgi:hypothetical protein
MPSLETTSTTRFGKEADIVKQLLISRSTFLRLRDNDPPTNSDCYYRAWLICLWMGFGGWL